MVFRTTARLALIALVGAAAGCNEVGASCTANIECGTGICFDGTCAASCAPEEGCDDGSACVMYIVHDPDGGIASMGYACHPGGGGPAVGEACGPSGMCAPGGVCVTNVVGEGTCRRACSGPADCSLPEFCTPQSTGGPSYCN